MLQLVAYHVDTVVHFSVLHHPTGGFVTSFVIHYLTIWTVPAAG
jgi:hypothetical protein